MSFTIIYITYPDSDTAKRICTHLIEKKLVACSNVFPIQSSYWWAGKIENDDEFVSIVKTTKENFDKVKKEVVKIHPYKVPCIMAIHAEANQAYEDWIKESVE